MKSYGETVWEAPPCRDRNTQSSLKNRPAKRIRPRELVTNANVGAGAPPARPSTARLDFDSREVSFAPPGLARRVLRTPGLAPGTVVLCRFAASALWRDRASATLRLSNAKL